MATIETLLNSIPTSKRIAVVGPNCNIDDDATPLYLAARLYGKRGSLHIYDKAPHAEPHSHGNIMSYLSGMIAWGNKVPLKAPHIEIMDMLNVTAKDGNMDVIIDNNTAKCILNTPVHGRVSYTQNTRKLLRAYHGMLQDGGKALFIYHPGFWNTGMSVLNDELRRHKEFHITARGIYTDTVHIQTGKRTHRFGSGELMHAITATKI